MTLYQAEIKEAEKYHLLEAVNSNGKRIVQLTKDNVARVEAIISLDSHYRNASDSSRGPRANRAGKITDVGSTRYWVEKLKRLFEASEITDDGYDYRYVIECLINAIDKDNSTHLNADGIGRNAVKNRIISRYSSPSVLIGALRSENNEYELLNCISEPDQENEYRHFSFATKFCHYCALYIFEGTEDEDKYSIFDSVLRKALPLYINYYLQLEVEPDDYDMDYKKYIKYIDEIRVKAEEKHDCKISRNGFDHLIWYFHKGEL